MRNHPYPDLATSDRHPRADKAAAEFLADIWSCHPEGYTFLCTRRPGEERWRTHAISERRRAAVRSLLTDHPAEEFDVYFSPNAFSEPRRLRRFALPTPYAWNDIDNADPRGFEPEPNVLWETSPGRFQGLWKWREASEGAIAEQYSRNLVMEFGGDRGGWSVTKILRLPGTINHKSKYRRPSVRLMSYDLTPHKLPLKLATISLSALREASAVKPHAYDPAEVLRRYRSDVGLEVAQLIRATRTTRSDRSKRVFQIVAALVTAGASDDEIASVLWGNPYFVEKCGQDLDALEAEITRIRGRVEDVR